MRTQEGDDKARPKQGEAEARKRLRSGRIDKILQKFEEKLDSQDAKVSVADYVRLLQFRDELEVEEPKEIRVTWVEPPETESANET